MSNIITKDGYRVEFIESSGSKGWTGSRIQLIHPDGKVFRTILRHDGVLKTPTGRRVATHISKETYQLCMDIFDMEEI
jgi:hypothetical protein